IDSGSQDPRAYYFRGLAHIRLGRDPEARDDFAEGARLEVADADRFYNVSKSLERVQGRNRLLLERYRSDARLLAFKELEQRRYERYQRIRRAEPDVLLRPTPSDSIAPPPADVDDVPVDEPAEEMPDDDLTDEPAEEMPDEDLTDEAPEESADDPFGDEPAEDESDAETPAADDPFGVGDADADEPPAEEPPAEDQAEDEDVEEPAADETPPDPDDEASAAPAAKAPAGVLSTLGGAFMRALDKVSKQASAARTASRPAAPPPVPGDELPDDELPDDVFGIGAPEADGDQPPPDADIDFPEADTDDPFGDLDDSAEPEDADDDPFGN
ncbi:MAG: hypothetical protein WD403_14915, partial [Pirellulales bacterium]